jgi:site-specific DNA-methyltransferase (adenine-specific)
MIETEIILRDKISLLRNKIILGDSRRILQKLPSESVDLIVTSPPYKKQDNFSLVLTHFIFKECYRVLKKDSLLFLNFGHLAENKEAPFEVERDLKTNIGFKLNETFIWVKNHFAPIRGERRVNNLYEFIFMMYKGKMPKLDRLSIGCPYVDKSNAKRFNRGKDLRCSGNVWFINYPTIQKKSQKGHKDRFPVELPRRCILLSNIRKRENPLVLDPFAGSSSTAVACQNLDVDFLMIEKDPGFFEQGKHRLAKNVY